MPQRSKLPDLEELTLARSPRMRPQLARVLTDLFLQAPGLHEDAEIDRYGTLLESLYSDLDIGTRIALAEKLAPRADAPPSLLRRLARDVPQVALPVLAGSPVLDDSDLLDLLGRTDPALRRAIASRPALGAPVGHRIAADEDREVLRAFLSNDAVVLTSGVALRLARRLIGDPDSAALLLRRSDVTGLSAAPLFLVADEAGRAKILGAVIDASLSQNGISSDAPRIEDTLGADLGTVMVEHAKAGRSPEIQRMMVEFLSVPPKTAQRVLADETGEPLLVALKALRLSESDILTLLILANPAVGCSVRRVFALADLAERLTPAASDLIVRSWRPGSFADRPHYLPQTEAGRPVRQSPPARRPVPTQTEPSFGLTTGAGRSG